MTFHASQGELADINAAVLSDSGGSSCGCSIPTHGRTSVRRPQGDRAADRWCPKTEG